LKATNHPSSLDGRWRNTDGEIDRKKAKTLLRTGWVLLLAGLTAGGLALAQSSPTGGAEKVTPSLRAIPDDNLAYPVYVTAGISSGSAFYLCVGTTIFLVTAKHVLFDPKTNQLYSSVATLLSYSKDLADATRNVLNVNLNSLQANKDLVSHPSADVVVVKLFDFEPTTRVAKPRAGVTPVSFAKAGLLWVDPQNVKTFDQVLTGNDVMIFGYPTSLGIQNVPQLDPLRPLLRKGIVAGTNSSTRFIVLDCPSYFGNSGGPVLEIDRQGFVSTLRIIGVVDQYVPFVQQAGSQTIAMQVETNSGYSLAVPMDYVLEIAK
jgi:hypothetical protein